MNNFLNLIINNNTIENNNYIHLVEEINDYLKNKTEFPLLSDYQ